MGKLVFKSNFSKWAKQKHVYKRNGRYVLPKNFMGWLPTIKYKSSPKRRKPATSKSKVKTRAPANSQFQAKSGGCGTALTCILILFVIMVLISSIK